MIQMLIIRFLNFFLSQEIGYMFCEATLSIDSFLHSFLFCFQSLFLVRKRHTGLTVWKGCFQILPLFYKYYIFHLGSFKAIKEGICHNMLQHIPGQNFPFKTEASHNTVQFPEACYAAYWSAAWP